MATNFITASGRTPLSVRFERFRLKPNSQFVRNSIIPTNPVQTTRFRSICSPNSAAFRSNYSPPAVFKYTGYSGNGYRTLGSHNFRASAVSGGAGGNGGSGGGNSGGRGEGGSGGDGGGQNNWSFVSWYLTFLEKYPVLTKAVTSALLTFIGDIICQVSIDKVPSLDFKRTFLFTLLGLVLVGPTLHLWYLYLSKLIVLPGPTGALCRLVLDQFIFAPTFIGVFLSSLITLEGRPSQVVPKLQQEWFSSVLANWKLWIPFQFLNFLLVPQPLQVLASNVVSLVWNVILSYKAHKEVLPS